MVSEILLHGLIIPCISVVFIIFFLEFRFERGICNLENIGVMC